MKFEAEGRAFEIFLRSLDQFIQTAKGQNNVWYQNDFLICFWRFLISKKLEQLEFKLEKNWGFSNLQKKLENSLISERES